MQIIDARARPPIKAFAAAYEGAAHQAAISALTARGWATSHSISSGSLELYFEEAKAAGLVATGLPGRAVNPHWSDAPNDEVFQACHGHPDFFFPYASIDLEDERAADNVPKLKQAGAKGLVIETGILYKPLYADDPSLNDVYEACEAEALPVLLMGGGEAGPDVSFCQAVHIDRLAMRFKDLQIVNVHGGWPYVQEAVGVAYFRENVWVMPDCYFPGLPGEVDYQRAIETFLQDRFMFATGYPYCPIGEMVERYNQLNLPDAIMEKIMFKNAARLFKLD